jgi:hypothetical protein
MSDLECSPISGEFPRRELPRRGAPMTLASKLDDVLMTFDCPHCGMALIKKGRWFKFVGDFRCAGCQRGVRMTYDDKIRLFAKHARAAHQSLKPPATR